MALFVGAMSGTSLDGVDAVLAEIDALSARVVAHHHRPFDATLVDTLAALNASGADELHRAALAANAVAETYADAVAALLQDARCGAGGVVAIGAHGQTVRHRPDAGYTLQLLNGALLAERSRIDVVCDLRSRDIAAGGQGAPLVPAFHARRFGRDDADVAVLNLGGIANLTLLPSAGPVTGFDTGPGNGLMDLWVQRTDGARYDAGGRRAAAGRVDAGWLTMLLDEPYFRLLPPKSTGRDLFNAGWLAARPAPSSITDDDALATLAELTGRTVADALLRQAPRTGTLVVCGGGAHNDHLLARLATLLPGTVVTRSDASGIDPCQVEALAFAWLAWAFVERRAGSLDTVTGARGARVLGALYPT